MGDGSRAVGSRRSVMFAMVATEGIVAAEVEAASGSVEGCNWEAEAVEGRDWRGRPWLCPRLLWLLRNDCAATAGWRWRSWSCCGPLAVVDEGWSAAGWCWRSWSHDCDRYEGPFLLGHQQVGWGVDVDCCFEDVHGLLQGLGGGVAGEMELDAAEGGCGIAAETLRTAALIPDDKDPRVLS
ncbi:hypothetical protein B296_00005458 [Ensete ventricosum]|uniref:Uncharacterized protein n=1 Tax=Ensete ventricosum TaxID=4639 RepID=A0A427BC58_ENSVE|nr:hypothetical protein B296_00005458 [Ensete ventricosum]